jgi:hypothetical protein
MFGICSAALFSRLKISAVQLLALPSTQYKHCHGKLN